MASSRAQQDTFVDDSDDACPLCVEEFDLSDKNFRPCPCGYQVCQFCYNNIKTNMNGLCPACRRPYDEKSIEWKVVSPEEFKADVALQARKKAAARQKEVERRQIESTNRKNLAGLRVVQKNLVYVVGLNPKIREEDLLQTLRGDQYFGQYGKIIKILVSKAKESSGGNQSIGVYVTFAKKQDAASCIAAVDGSQNGDRILRAQYGTTKYCSAYLRNEVCNNRGCMFLHETGEDNDSFSRQDLSSMNAVSTQRPAPSASAPSSSAKASQQTAPIQPQPPPLHHALQNHAATSQSMARNGSKDEPMSRSDSGDGSALPSTAAWVKHPQIQQSRRSSQAASRSTPSPKISNGKLPALSTEGRTAEENPAPAAEAIVQSESEEIGPPSIGQQETLSAYMDVYHTPTIGLERAVKVVTESTFKWTLDRTLYDSETLNVIDNYPPLFDINGGAVRYAMKVQQEEERRKEEEEQRKLLQAISAVEDDDNLAGGSLQLGGEPETQENEIDLLGQLGSGRRSLPQPRTFGTTGGMSQPFDGQVSMTNNFADLSMGIRSLTPQQQQQLTLIKSHSQQHDALFDQLQHGIRGNTSQHQPQLSNPFQAQNQQLSALSGHTRQASRYTFSNDSVSASATIKPATSAQLMAQQSAMMPPQLPKSFAAQSSQQPNLHTNFYSGVQGPPPGLKSSGTPPISGGGMFGQGHGFASAMSGSLGMGASHLGGKNSNDDLMRDFLRGRSGIGNGLGSEVGKREFMFPSFLQKPTTSTTSPAPGLQSPLYGPHLGVYNGYQDQGHVKQKKKGKKHRHANTSSSGGGGIVDLADPSILQARVHHGGAGQGPYGGTQGQGVGEGPSSVSTEIPASGSTRASGPMPMNKTPNTDRPAMTLPAPPGLSSTLEFPPLATLPKVPATPALSKKQFNPTVSSITPAIPFLSMQPIRPATPVTMNSHLKNHHAQVLPMNTDLSLVVPAEAEDIQQLIKLNTRETQLIQPQIEPKVGNSTSSETTLQSKSVIESKKLEVDTIIADPVDKRQRPGKLDIAAAKDASRKDLELTASTSKQTKPVTPSKTTRQVFSNTSQPGTPATAVSHSSASPVPRHAPLRTIRVVQAPNSETYSRAASSITTITTPATVVTRQISRQPSLTSIYQPGTPVNEMNSDNVSLTSTSISRPSSPPISKVGSAPIRQTTKSQLKKERRRRMEDSRQSEDPASATMAEDSVQGPIIGRKKKAKKSKLQLSADSTPIGSRPQSPSRQDEPIKDEKNTAEAITDREEIKVLKEPKKETRKKPIERATNEPELLGLSNHATEIAEKFRKTQLSAAAIFADLQKRGMISPNVVDFFRSVPGVNHRFELAEADLAEMSIIPHIADEGYRSLAEGKAICVETVPNRFVVILPDRRILRGFSREQAERYVDLRQKALDATSPSIFRSARHNVERWLDTEMESVNASADFAEPQIITSIENMNASLESLHDMPDFFALTNSRNKNFDAGLLWNDTGVSSAEDLPVKRPTLSVEEAERELAASRKETEALEKRLNGLLKKNRKLLASGH